MTHMKLQVVDIMIERSRCRLKAYNVSGRELEAYIGITDMNLRIWIPFLKVGICYRGMRADYV